MKYLILLLLFPFVAFGQGKVPFATSGLPAANTYAYTNNGIWTDSALILANYKMLSDSVVLGIDATGKAYRITKPMIQNWSNQNGYLIPADTIGKWIGMGWLNTLLQASYAYSFDASTGLVNYTRLSGSTGTFAMDGRYSTYAQTDSMGIPKVSTVSSLCGYTGGSGAVLLADTLQGGLFFYTDAIMPADSGLVFPAPGKGSGYWVRSSIVNPKAEWWGVNPSSNIYLNAARINRAIASNFVASLVIGRSLADTIRLTQPILIAKPFKLINQAVIQRAANNTFTWHLSGTALSNHGTTFAVSGSAGLQVGDQIAIQDTSQSSVQGGNAGQTRWKYNSAKILTIVGNTITIDSPSIFQATTSLGYVWRVGSLLYVSNTSNVDVSGGLWDANKANSFDGNPQYYSAAFAGAVEDVRADNCISFFNTTYGYAHDLEAKNSVGQCLSVKGICDNTVIERVYLHDAHDKALVFAAGVNTPRTSNNITAKDSRMEWSDYEDGVAIQPGTNDGGHNYVFDNCLFAYNGRYGAYCDNQSLASTGLTFNNCRFIRNGCNVLLMMRNNSLFNGCLFQSPQRIRHNPTYTNASFVTASVSIHNSVGLTLDNCIVDSIASGESLVSLTSVTGKILFQGTDFKNMMSGYYAGVIPSVVVAATASVHVNKCNFVNIDSSKVYYSRTWASYFGATKKSTQYIDVDNLEFGSASVKRYPIINYDFGVQGYQFTTTTTYIDSRIADIGRVTQLYKNGSGYLRKAIEWDNLGSGFSVVTPATDSNYYNVTVSSDLSEFYGLQLETKRYSDSTGIIGADTINAINNYITALKNSGAWAQAYAIYLTIWDNSRACSFNLKDPTLYRLTFQGSNTFTSNGWNKTTSGYAQTGIVPSTATTINDISMSVYSTGFGLAAGYESGVANSGTTQRLQFVSYGSSGEEFRAYNTTTGALTYVSVPTAAQYTTGSRTSSSAIALYRDGVSVATGSSSGGTLPTLEIYVGGYNNNGSAVPYSVTRVYQIFTIDKGLTATQVLARSNAFYALKRSLNK